MIPQNRQAPLEAKLSMRCGNAPATADFSFLETGEQCWDIEVATDADRLALRDGGETIELAGQRESGKSMEYPQLYDRFARLIARRASHVDLAPLRLVSDALRLAKRTVGPSFDW